MRVVTIGLSDGEKILVYSGDDQIVLQVRRLVHGDADPLAASFKSGVQLDAIAAMRVAAELLSAAASIATAAKV